MQIWGEEGLLKHRFPSERQESLENKLRLGSHGRLRNATRFRGRPTMVNFDPNYDIPRDLEGKNSRALARFYVLAIAFEKRY